MGATKHVTSACLHCRRRKVKCDGNEKCSNCAMSQLDCVYNAEADMRRVSAKKVITGLRARVAELENLLRENRIEQPSPDENVQNSPSATSSAAGNQGTADQDDNSEMGENATGSVNTGNSTTAITNAPSSIGKGDQSTDSDHDGSPSPVTPFSSFAGPGEINSHHLVDLTTPLNLDGLGLQNGGGNNNHPGFMSLGIEKNQQDQYSAMAPSMGFDSLPATPADSEDDITDILAARVGALRIAEDGELRYYGPTSNLHVHPNGCQSLSRSTIRHVETEGLSVLERLGLAREIPLETEAHLARLYFSWEDPAIHVVEESIFFAEKENTVVHGRKSPYYSETLNNAICAIGANLACGEYLGLPEPAPEFFSSRAKALLDVEMDSPTVATVQALVVMSASEAAFTRDARGWLYSGMAARLSADLGLHLDVTRHRQTGVLSDRDLEIRRIAFWGVFIHEHMWSMYVGRPWSIGLGNITLSRPSSSLDSQRKWKPYPGKSGQANIPDEGLDFPLETCTEANISLCEFMPRINTTLYSGQRSDIKGLVDFLTHTRDELWAWLGQLHPALHIDTSNPSTPFVPAVLQLHMQFYATFIALYRPYLSSHFVRGGHTLASSRDQTVLFDATPGCVSAAHEIAQILRCYQRQHSLRRFNIQIVHIIFTACLVFIHDVCTRHDNEARASQSDLQFCCQALGEIGHAYGNATRALEVVILVRSEWQRQVSTGRAPCVGLKRRSTSMGAETAEDRRPDISHQAKRRTFCSPQPVDISRQPVCPNPPTFSAFQMLYDDYAGQVANMTMPMIDEDSQCGPFGMLMDVNASLGELVMPMEWPNSQQLQPMYTSSSENLENGLMSEEETGETTEILQIGGDGVQAAP